MFKKLLSGISDRAAHKEQEEFLGLLRMGTDFDMASALASAALARHGLKEAGSLSTPFPEKYFRGDAPVNPEAAAQLSAYNMELIRLRNHMARKPDPVLHALAAGASVYIATFRALARPDLMASGKMVWRELVRGTEGYLFAVMRVKPDMPPDWADAIFPLPNVFAPAEA